MTYIYDKLKGEKKLIWAKSELEYENAEGAYTFHYCPYCKVNMCRANRCVSCWEKEIKQLEGVTK